jgi:hypothetical protein
VRRGQHVNKDMLCSSKCQRSSTEAGYDGHPENDENSQAATAVLESPPADDLGQDKTDESEEDSFLPSPVARLINSIW